MRNSGSPPQVISASFWLKYGSVPGSGGRSSARTSLWDNTAVRIARRSSVLSILPMPIGPSWGASRRAMARVSAPPDPKALRHQPDAGSAWRSSNSSRSGGAPSRSLSASSASQMCRRSARAAAQSTTISVGLCQPHWLRFCWPENRWSSVSVANPASHDVLSVRARSMSSMASRVLPEPAPPTSTRTEIGASLANHRHSASSSASRPTRGMLRVKGLRRSASESMWWRPKWRVSVR